MNQFTNSVSAGFSNFFAFLPTLIGAILLLLLAWIIARLVKKGTEKGLKAVGFGERLTKWGVTNTEEQANSTIESLAKVLYYVVWLLFLPGILDMLGLTSIAQPISNMLNGVLNFLPNFVAAVFILVVGIFVGRFVKNLVYNLLLTVNIDKWIAKATKSDTESPSAEQKTTLAKVVANIVYIVILVPVITVALETLQIQSISQPIIGVLNVVISAIPNIIVAIILLAAGILIAGFVGDLLTNLLKGTGVNKLTKYIETAGTPSFDLAKLIGRFVEIIIVVFFLVEALNVLNLAVLNMIGAAIISYLPLAISALLILAIGLIGGSLLGSYVTKATGSKLSGEVLKYILLTLSVFMALDQLQFATSIVNLAFLLILAGLSVAFALSFGIGGRDFAKRQLEKLETKVQNEEKIQDDTSDSDSNF